MLGIGQKVRIKKEGSDWAFNNSLAGLVGTVKRRDVGSDPMSVGRPTDPLYAVETSRGTDGFWGEELEAI